MKRSTGPRKKANFSESIDLQLNMYALAAGAAGVGALCLAKPAEARIVYTPTHVVLNDSYDFYKLDFSHNGITDLSVGIYSRSFSGPAYIAVNVHPAGRNTIVGTSPHFYFQASALRNGIRIGPRQKFGALSENVVMASAGHNSTGRLSYHGKWVNVKNRYLGVKFYIKGKTHYGWVRASISVSAKKMSAEAVLTGYAYETIPGKAIIAGATKGPDDDAQPVPATHTSPPPKPATLGMLALGAPGLSAWRREETLAATSDRN
jgi:hypothetical protein